MMMSVFFFLLVLDYYRRIPRLGYDITPQPGYPDDGNNLRWLNQEIVMKNKTFSSVFGWYCVITVIAFLSCSLFLKGISAGFISHPDTEKNGITYVLGTSLVHTLNPNLTVTVPAISQVMASATNVSVQPGGVLMFVVSGLLETVWLMLICLAGGALILHFLKTKWQVIPAWLSIFGLISLGIYKAGTWAGFILALPQNGNLLLKFPLAVFVLFLGFHLTRREANNEVSVSIQTQCEMRYFFADGSIPKLQ